jgi:hypothetical protein
MIDGIKTNLELGPTMCSEPTSVNMQEDPLQVSRGYTERDMLNMNEHILISVLCFYIRPSSFTNKIYLINLDHTFCTLYPLVN